MGGLIEERHALRATLARACTVPDVGAHVTSLAPADLAWAEANGIASAADVADAVRELATAAGVETEIIGSVPLVLLSGSGSGSGSGLSL